MLRRAFLATLFVLGGFFHATLRAADVEVSVPADTKFLLQLDLQAFRATPLGAKLFEIAMEKAKAEIAQGFKGGQGPDFKKLDEMLGFDPFEEIQRISVSASDFERPDKSLVISIRLRKTTGNLEGLLLGLPGYEAQAYGKYQIYSAAPDNETHVFGAIHTDAKGEKSVLFASQREAVVRLLDNLDGKATAEG